MIVFYVFLSVLFIDANGDAHTQEGLAPLLVNSLDCEYYNANLTDYLNANNNNDDTVSVMCINEPTEEAALNEHLRLLRLQNS